MCSNQHFGTSSAYPRSLVVLQSCKAVCAQRKPSSLRCTAADQPAVCEDALQAVRLLARNFFEQRRTHLPRTFFEALAVRLPLLGLPALLPAAAQQARSGRTWRRCLDALELEVTLLRLHKVALVGNIITVILVPDAGP